MKIITLLLLITLVLVFTCGTSQAAEFYIEGGIGYHDTAIDCPESCLDSTLGYVGAGIDVPVTDHVDIGVNYSHYSGLLVRESGYGLNAIMIKARYSWEF